MTSAHPPSESTARRERIGGERIGRDRIGWSLAIFSLALVVRVAHLWELHGTPVFDFLIGDAASYDAWARRIAAGDWLGAEVFYQAPLYPYFLAVAHGAVGDEVIAVRCVQAALGAGSCVLLALAGWRWFSQRAGIAAGLLLAVYAPAIFADTTIQKSVLGLFLLCAALWVLARLVERATAGRCIGLGALIAALVLTRENALVFAGVLLPWLVVRAPGAGARRLAPAALFLAGMAAVLTPVALRNWHVGGGFYLTTSQLGPNLYIGNHPGADGTYVPLVPGRGDPKYERLDATALAEAALGRALTPSEVSSFFVRRVFAYIGAEPAEWGRLVARKLALAWNRIEVVDSVSLYAHAEASRVLRWSAALFHFGTLAPLAILGAFVTWPARARLLPLYLLFLGYGASLLAFYVFGRYRLPLVPFVALFAGAALAGVRGWLAEGPRARVAAGVATAAAAGVLCNWPLQDVDERYMRSVTHYNLGNELYAAGQPDASIAQFREAIRLRADNAQAVHNLGAVLAGQGDLGAARLQYERALEISPDYADAHFNLARTLVETGDPEGAIDHFEHGLRSDPGRAAAYAELASAYAATGDLGAAIRCSERALRSDPTLSAARALLEDLRARRSEADDASRRRVSAACSR